MAKFVKFNFPVANFSLLKRVASGFAPSHQNFTVHKNNFRAKKRIYKLGGVFPTIDFQEVML